MTIVLGSPTEKQVREELRAMKRASKRAYATPASARAFLLKHGFITKAENYIPATADMDTLRYQPKPWPS